MNSVFNTAFESSLRLVLLMSCIDSPVEFERITALDTITIYGFSSEYADYDLHANANRRTDEYGARRYSDRNALRRLVLSGYANIDTTDDNINYIITEKGKELAESLHSDYADKYRSNAGKVISILHSEPTGYIVHIARDIRRETE